MVEWPKYPSGKTPLLFIVLYSSQYLTGFQFKQLTSCRWQHDYLSLNWFSIYKQLHVHKLLLEIENRLWKYKHIRESINFVHNSMIKWT